ncbi:hypothetical protein GCM10008905_14430 [Clostridium malenominatum]|uniref:Group-specific protein n=1 Tax=Clostridium malenominatum TaxID=1539 RepID=A0ABN1IWC2_9CLOT
MVKKFIFTFIFIVLFTTPASSQESTKIEIFHINEQKVVMTIESTPKIEKEITNYLNNITGIYPKFNPIPREGYMIKVPLETPFALEKNCITTFVEVVIVVFPKEETPFLIIFDSKDSLLCLNFKGNVNKLLKKLDFQIPT